MEDTHYHLIQIQPISSLVFTFSLFFSPSLSFHQQFVLSYISALLFLLPNLTICQMFWLWALDCLKGWPEFVSACKLKGALHYLAAFVAEWTRPTGRRQVMALSASINWNIARRSPQAWQDRCLLALERKQAKKELCFKLIHAVQPPLLQPSPFCWDMLQSNASGGVGSGGVRYNVCERTFKTNRKILFSPSFIILKVMRQQALTKKCAGAGWRKTQKRSRTEHPWLISVFPNPVPEETHQQ